MNVISIIVPCYNEEQTIQLFYQEIIKIMRDFKEVEFECIFINDGSKDKSLEIIREISCKDHHVRYISFTRNYGKEAAIFAGLEASKGDYITLMDADLQDPPALLKEMYDIIQQGKYDCVATRRVTRVGEPAIRSFFAKCFYKIINRISEVEIVDGARDFRLMTRKMVDSILQLKEYNRFSKGIFSWVGFETKWLEYENIERVAGETKWSFWKLFLYSIEGIIAFSTVPLALASILGIILCLISMIAIGVIIFKTLMWNDPVAGWPSLSCIIIFIGGIQLFFMGILGQYMARSYLEVKRRPIYLVKETEKDAVNEIEK